MKIKAHFIKCGDIVEKVHIFRMVNCSESHSHGLDDVDGVRGPKHFRTMIKPMVIKPYPVKDITKHIPTIVKQDISPGRMNVFSSVKVTRDFVRNTQVANGYENAVFDKKVNVSEDTEKTISFLESAGYQTEIIAAANASSSSDLALDQDFGLIFASKHGLEALQTRSYLVQMDATHCTNQHDMYIFPCIQYTSD